MYLKDKLLQLAKNISNHPTFKLEKYSANLWAFSGRDIIGANTEAPLPFSAPPDAELTFSHFKHAAISDISLRNFFLVATSSSLPGDFRNGDPGQPVRHERLYFSEKETNELVKCVFERENFGQNDYRSVRTGLPLTPENNTPDQIKYRRTLALDFYDQINKEIETKLRLVNYGESAAIKTLDKPPRKLANEWGEKLWNLYNSNYTWNEPGIAISKIHDFTKESCMRLARQGCFMIGGY